MNITILQALILGLIQGITEFLPLSSSGHLAVVQNIIHVRDNMLFLTIFLHLGTLIAVIIFFRSEIFQLTKKRLIWLLIASLPIFIIGFLFHKQINTAFSSLLTIGIMLIITGFMNLFGNKPSKKKSLKIVNSPTKQALFIGLLQALAILPGISRSASVFFAHRVLDINNKKTFVNTFLLSIPVILASVLFELFNYRNHIAQIALSLPILIGITSSFIVGFISLMILSKLIIKNQFKLFGYYCVVIGSIITVFYY